MNYREEKTTDLIKNMAAIFLQEESNGISMLTVTRVSVSSDLKNAIIFFTVLPETQTENALEFTKRKRSDFRNYVKEHSRLPKLPFFDFEIDKGEKNRQKIESLLK